MKGCVNLLDTWLGQFTRLFVFGVRQADLLQSNHKVLFAEKPNLFIVVLLMKTTVHGIEKQATYAKSSCKCTTFRKLFEFVDCMDSFATRTTKNYHTSLHL